MTFSSWPRFPRRTNTARVWIGLLVASAAVSSCDPVSSEQREGVVSEARNSIEDPSVTAQGLAPGQTVEDFEALTQTGYLARLDQLIDKPLAVLFCRQLDVRCEEMAQTIRDHWNELMIDFGMVAMITPSGWAETRSFSNRHQLPQLLLADRSGKLVQAFGLSVSGAKHYAYILGEDRTILRAITGFDPSRIHSALLASHANSRPVAP